MALSPYARHKDKSIPGNYQLFFGLTASATTVTLTGEEVTTFTAASGTFAEIKADVDGITFTNSGKCNKAGSVYEPKLEVKLTVANQKLVNVLLKDLNDNIGKGLSLIYTDNNKQSYLFGSAGKDAALEKDRDITSFDYAFDSGMAPGEDAKQLVTLTFTAKTLSVPIPFNSTINTTLVNRSATFLTLAT